MTQPPRDAGPRSGRWPAGAMAAVWLAATFLVAHPPVARAGQAAPMPEQSVNAATVPTGFVDELMISGLNNPTQVEFSSDGRVFVAEKSGLIRVYDYLGDPTPEVFADLRTEVHNFWDRGLLGLELAPGFPNPPYVYALYTRDAAIGGSAPRWGTVDATSDGCPTPPGATDDGCVVSGRLVRLTASGNQAGQPADAGRRLVPAVSEPLYRRHGLRSRRRPVCEWWGRSQLQLRGLRPGWQPAQSMRRPAERPRHRPFPTER